MENIKFQTLNELHMRLNPALKSKCAEFKRNGMSYINEDIIWNYLKENVWNISTSLELCDMVDDIFNCTLESIYDYYKSNKGQNSLL